MYWQAGNLTQNLHLASPWQQRLIVLRLAIPIMLANITVPLVGVVDTAVMGRMADPVYIGATAIGATVFSSIYWLFGFLRMGTGGLVAQAFGAQELNEARLILLRGITLSLIIGSLLFLLQQPIINLSLTAFSTSDELWMLTKQYFNIRIFSAPATLMLYVVIGTLIGLQQMRAVFTLQLVLNLCNIILNITFFKWMNWGIEGVALATVISEYLALAVGWFLISRHIPVSVLSFLDGQLFNREKLIQLFTVNINLFIRTLCLIASFYWLTIASSRFGEVALAANTIVIQLLHVMAHGLDGFSHTAETLAGQAFGRKHRQQFCVAVRVCAEWGLVFALLFSIGYWLAGQQLILLMTNIDEVSIYANQFILWFSLAPIFSMASFLLDGIFIGVTHTREMRNAMIISLAMFILASSTLPLFFGNHGLWASYIVLMVFRGLTLAYWYPRILRQFKI